MNWITGIIIFTIVGIGVVYFTDFHRYFGTFLLIQKVKPYEQAGNGAGKILVIGDSTGYGTGAQNPVDSVAGRLGQDFPDYQIQNNSGNGRKIAGALGVVESLNEPYELIVLQIGANDLLAKRSVDEVIADMQRLVETALMKTPHVVILTAGNIGAVPVFTGEEAQYYEGVSRDYTARMISIYESVESVSFVSLFDEPENDPFVEESEKYIASDGLHPTGAGYEVWFEKALPYLEDALRKIDEK